MELEGINYRYTANLLKFFIGEHLDRKMFTDASDIDVIIENVKSLAPVQDITYTFDESIWLPDRPEDYESLILFGIKLTNSDTYASCYLYLKAGRQETIPIHPAYYSRKVIPKQNIVRGVLTATEHTYFEKYVVSQKYIQVLKKELEEQAKTIFKLRKKNKC